MGISITINETGISYKERLANLLNGPSFSTSGRGDQPSIPKIQRVQPYLRNRTEFGKHYAPRLLSIGPIHHGDENLQLGEHYKERWTRAYLYDDPKIDAAAAQRFYEDFASKIEDFKKLYSEDAIKKYENKNGELAWILFVDGCSILRVMNIAGKCRDSEKCRESEAASELEIKIDQLALLMQDMLLLENQLPYELLVLLTGDEHKTKQSMLKFLRMVRGRYTDNSLENIIDKGPRLAHLLDCLHKIIVAQPDPGPSTPLPSRSGDHSQKPISSYKVRNIQELKAAGISVVRSGKGSIEDVDFKPKSCGLWTSGRLKLPEITVDDFTAPTFMNLIAYEMCPDFSNKFDVSSYVAFLDLLIDHQDDVKELRSAGVLQNHLGNDEEVAKLFNIISTDLIADGSKYAKVRCQIEDHCSRKSNTWRAKLFTENFSSPWTCVAFFAGIILFVLTVLQTLYTIRPRGEDHEGPRMGPGRH